MLRLSLIVKRSATISLFGSALFLIIAPGFFTVWLPIWLARRESLQVRSLSDPVTWLLIPIIAAATSVLLICFWDFAVRGLGTPAPIAPTKFLVRGRIYRHVRNPMYLAVIGIMLAESFLLAPFSYTLLLWAAGFFLATNMFVFLYEEPTLRRRFGAEYETYCKEVPRWIPRLRRKSETMK